MILLPKSGFSAPPLGPEGRPQGRWRAGAAAARRPGVPRAGAGAGCPPCGGSLAPATPQDPINFPRTPLRAPGSACVRRHRWARESRFCGQRPPAGGSHRARPGPGGPQRVAPWLCRPSRGLYGRPSGPSVGALNRDFRGKITKIVQISDLLHGQGNGFCGRYGPFPWVLWVE